MNVTKPILVATAKTRGQVQMVIGKITSTKPPGERRYVADGALVIESQLPEREGQILLHVPPESGGTAVMYVVVDLDGGGTLYWAPVVPNEPEIDPRTGKVKDPLYDFYGIHAS